MRANMRSKAESDRLRVTYGSHTDTYRIISYKCHTYIAETVQTGDGIECRECVGM